MWSPESRGVRRAPSSCRPGTANGQRTRCLIRLSSSSYAAIDPAGSRRAPMEPQWLTYGKQLQAIASTGLHFARDQFDRERYEEVARIANEMLAELGNVPIERI